MLSRRFAAVIGLTIFIAGCVPILANPPRKADTSMPVSFVGSRTDPGNTGALEASKFFADPDLIALIRAALVGNQELNITSLEVFIARTEVLAREGEYLPRVDLKAGASALRKAEDTGEFETHKDGAEYVLGLFASWEIDIWKKLRNAKAAAAKRYLASLAGKRFLVTNLVAEVANAYYELLAFDNQLEVLKRNIALQRQALEVVRLQKQAGKVTELAVKRFEAEVLKNRSRRFSIRQQILQTENRINFLVGRYPQPIQRSSRGFLGRTPRTVSAGAPAHLLSNRPDVKQAELNLQAAKLDVEVARAQFYPTLELNAGVAVSEAFEYAEFPSSPASLAYRIVADLAQPLWNRKAIKANYFAANSKQMQAVFDYERTILQAYNEVTNQVAMVENLTRSYDLRTQEVEQLNQSITISSMLFRSARADYMEVLLTRRDALNAQMELIETKGKQLRAVVKLYRALGGGWK